MCGSTVKWVSLAIFIGIVVGAATAVFLKLLHVGCTASERINRYYILMPIAFFVSSYTILKLAPDAEGHGTEKVIQAIHQKSGKIDIKVVPVKLFTTIITIMFGGSAGNEGPCTQIGGGIASFLSKLFKMDEMDRKKFVVCGVSAGVAGVFGTPVAGAVFAVEILYIGKFSYIVLLPSLIASYVSCFVNKYLGINYHTYIINFTKANEIKMFFNMIVFGIFIGLIAMLFIRIFTIIEEIFIEKIKLYKPLKGVIGGGLIVLIVIIAGGNTEFIGLGTSVIDEAISGNEIMPISFIMKMFTTSITLGSGGSGGILTPIFYIGATAGNVWAQLIHGNIALFTSIGMVAFLAACANTPLASIIIAMELFGINIATYASVACVISYLMVGHKSVYPTQILAITKSQSLNMDMNCEIQEAKNIKIVSNKSRILDKITDISKK
jgi:H+/Cl- antiporter ClcA